MAARASALLPHEGDVAANARQRRAIASALRHLRGASSNDMLLAAEALRLARVELDRVTGRAGVEDMLDTLFGRFCIGK
jgi:tRNA modification GTPase